jgi:O-antigen/teichoic acid export membrane protein
MGKISSVISIGIAITVQNILGLITEIIIARYFSPMDFATYQQSIMVLSFAPLLTFGFIESVVYFASHYKDDRKIISNTFFHLLLAGGISTAIVYYLRNCIALWLNNPSLEISLRVYCWIPFFSFLISTIPNYFIGKKKPATSRNLIIIIYLIIAALIILTLFSFSNLTPSQLLSVRLLATIFVALMALCILIIHVGWFFKFFDFDNYRELAQYAFSLGIAKFIPLLYINLDKIMVSAMLGPVAFAYYKIGAREIPFSTIIILSLGSALLPYYVNSIKENDLEEVRRLWFKSTLRAALVNFPLGLMCFAFAPFIITTIFGKAYEQSANIFRIYTLILLIRVNDGDVLAKTFNANKIILQASIFVFIFNLISNYILIKLIGAMGAALASLITIALAWSYRLIKYCDLLKCGFNQIMPWKQLGFLMTVTLCCTAIAKATPIIFGEETLLTVSTGIVLAFSLFSIFIWNTNQLDYSDKTYLKKLMNKFIFLNKEFR